MENDNGKIITISFLLTAFLAAFVGDILFSTLSSSLAFIANLRSMELVRHGLPVALGIGTFIALQFNSNIKLWADEVVVEIRKVVWPSRKDTTVMTIVCCVMVLAAGVMFGVFDFLSGNLIKLIVN